MSKMRYQHGKGMSARPKINKLVDSLPLYVLYKPSGVLKDSLETRNLALEEMEALKLKEVEDLDQSEAAKKWEYRGPHFRGSLSLQGKNWSVPSWKGKQ